MNAADVVEIRQSFLDAGIVCARPFTLRKNYWVTSSVTGSRILAGDDDYTANCRNRRESVCAYCSKMYKRDAKRLIEDVLSTVGPDTLAFFVTLTAPGAEAFEDPESVLRWNAAAPTLWHRTVTQWRERIECESLNFFRTWEWQGRGLLHAHALVLITPSADTPSHRDVATQLRTVIPYSPAEMASRQERNLDTLEPAHAQDANGNHVRWGSRRIRTVVEMQHATGDDLKKIGNYVTKYVVKSVDDDVPVLHYGTRDELHEAGLPDAQILARRIIERRFRSIALPVAILEGAVPKPNSLPGAHNDQWSEILERLWPPETEPPFFWATLFATYLEDRIDGKAYQIAKELGTYGKHWVSKSHGWKTFKELREERKTYATENGAQLHDPTFHWLAEFDGETFEVETDTWFVGPADLNNHAFEKFASDAFFSLGLELVRADE